MEEKNNSISQEPPANNLNKCPYCACCFCNEPDLRRHIEIFGRNQVAHQQEFQRVHGRLEHGSFGGPE